MLISTTTPTDTTYPAELLLIPESDADRDSLERLVEFYAVVGFGRDADSMRLNHVRVGLVPAN